MPRKLLLMYDSFMASNVASACAGYICPHRFFCRCHQRFRELRVSAVRDQQLPCRGYPCRDAPAIYLEHAFRRHRHLQRRRHLPSVWSNRLEGVEEEEEEGRSARRAVVVIWLTAPSQRRKHSVLLVVVLLGTVRFSAPLLRSVHCIEAGNGPNDTSI